MSLLFSLLFHILQHFIRVPGCDSDSDSLIVSYAGETPLSVAKSAGKSKQTQMKPWRGTGSYTTGYLLRIPSTPKGNSAISSKGQVYPSRVGGEKKYIYIAQKNPTHTCIHKGSMQQQNSTSINWVINFFRIQLQRGEKCTISAMRHCATQDVSPFGSFSVIFRV